MSEDQVVKFIHGLYQNQIILWIVIAGIIINALAAFTISARTIWKLIITTVTVLRKWFYTKRHLKQDVVQLRSDLTMLFHELSVDYREVNTATADGIAEVFIQGDSFYRKVYVAYLQRFKKPVEFVHGKLHKYNCNHPALDELLGESSHWKGAEDIKKVIKELGEMEVALNTK